METFAAIVQDMLSAIALKYNLKEKGLDPEAVPEIVAQAFEAIVRRAPPAAAAAPAPPRPAPPRVVIAQPEGAEPAYPGQAGPEVNPVSEELLHRAIRSNVELAEALGQVVRDLSQGLATIQGQADRLLADREDASRTESVASLQREVRRLQAVLRDVGQAAAGRLAPRTPVRAPAPPQVPPTPPRGTTAAPVPPRPGAPPAAPAAPPPVLPPRGPAIPVPAPPVAAAPRPSPVVAPVPPAVAPPAAAPAPGLDALVAEVVAAVRSALAARPVSVENRVARGAALPRCSPASLRRALAGLLQGLAAVLTPGTGILLRAERKPVLLRGRDGSELKRDFLMIALTHASGLAEADQQQVLKGALPGPLGDAQRLVREMGGFMRFAPLPGGALETRVFLPA
jgi:hypothetical protein